MRSTIAALVLCCLTLSTLGQTPPRSSAAIEAMLKKRIDEEKNGFGIIVGLIDGKETKVVGFGKADDAGKLKLDGNTVLEIGSVTKVFTALLLADMVAKGEVKLDDPISKYLPPNVTAPTRDGKEITLEHLATHTSSLPRMPRNHVPKDIENPFADYTEANLFTFLSQFTPPRGIGEKFEYSNLGVALLGTLLARKAGKPYDELVRERICVPLGMKETRIVPASDLAARVATGHDEYFDAVKASDLGPMAPAGALRSTTNDMLRLIAAALNPTKSPLAAAFAEALKPHAPTDRPGDKIGLAWMLRGDSIVWHNGATAGFRSFVGFNPTTGRGVVVLANSAYGVEDIGFHLLDENLPLKELKPRALRKIVAVDQKILDGYVGRYEIVPAFAFVVTKENGGLVIQPTNQPKTRIFAESETKFFIKPVDVQFEFVKDATGKVTELAFTQNGRTQTAKKVE